MSIDESLIPSVGLLVADLENMSELERAVLLSNVFEGGLRELFLDELAIQGILTGLDGIVNSDRGLSSLGCRERGVNYNQI